MSTYTKTTFVDDGPPAIDAAELNKMGDGIEAAHSEIENLKEDATTTTIDATVGGTVDVPYANSSGVRLTQVISIGTNAVTFTFSGWPTGAGEQSLALTFSGAVPTITWPPSITGAPDLSSVPSAGKALVEVTYKASGYWILLAGVSA